MPAMSREPTVQTAYRSSIGDLIVFVGTLGVLLAAVLAGR
jgi:hypothetical protein